MIPEKVKEWIVDLLDHLDLVGVIELSKSSTSGIIRAETRSEAYRLIIQHHESVRSLLNRKKMTKAILFKYLHEKGVAVSSTADKSKLIESLISFWETSIGSSVNEEKDNQSSSSTIKYDLNNDLEEYSSNFIRWFYCKLNEYVTQKGQSELILPSDFWSESEAEISLFSQSNNENQRAQGSEGIVDMFASLQYTYSLLFLPNTSESGRRVKLEPHGMIGIMSCGTLHSRTGDFIGLFEQIFLLIKDPLNQDSWKIQKTQLKLSSQSNIQQQSMLPLT